MEYSDTVLPIMRKVRDIALPKWGTAKAVHQKDESSWSIVTQVDIDVEQFVAAELAKIHPEIVFVGEERGGNRSAPKFWLMDPIDGTAHFVRGLPFCTSMLALIDNGKVVFSAIYDFVNDKMYWAEKGKGAFRDSDKLSVSSTPLKDAFVSFEIRLEKEGNVALRQELRSKTNLINTSSAGWEFAMVASGKLEGRICFDPYGQDYDFAPGTLLVSEAGGTVTNIGSQSYDYRNLNFIAASPTIYKELTEGANMMFPTSS